MSDKTKIAALIDADSVAYAAAAAAEDIDMFEEGGRTADFNLAVRLAERELVNIGEAVKANKVVVTLTDRENFRKDVSPDYKANRKATVKPLALHFVRQHLIAHHKALIKPRLEADDVVGILATNPDILPGWRKVVCSIDKDLRSVPGHLYNWRKASNGVLEIPLRKADGFFFVQVLAGDPVDGFTGLPGVGIIRAIPIIKGKTPAEAWAAIVAAYEAKGRTADDALVQARLARILRHEDYDYSTGAPLLWTPPKLI